MERRLMKGFVLVSSLFVLMLGGCGGGGPKKEGETDAAGLSACDPSKGLPGTKVTCHVDKDFNDACTVFFGNTALEAGPKSAANTYVFDKEAVTVELIVPSSNSKTLDITYCCGDCGAERPMIAKGFRIDAAADGDEDEEASPTETAGGTSGGSTGDEEIVPGGGSGGGGTSGGGGGAQASADDDGDGVANVIDACPGTPSGSSVNSVGCSAAQQPPAPSPPAPAAATITTFHVDPVKVNGTKLSTYKVIFNYANAKKAYLWGNIFNREASDDSCGKVSGRYLLTDDDGSNWDGNEGNFTNLGSLTTGVLCQGQDSNTPNGCKYKAPGSASLTAPTFEKAGPFGDRLERKGLYFLDEKKFEIVEMTKMEFVLEKAENNPDCRINLTKNGSLVTSDNNKIYTRSFVKNGKACLAVQGMDDAWKVKCVEVDALAPTVTGIQVEVKPDPKVIFKIGYKDAPTAPTVTWNEPGKPAANCSKINAASHHEDEYGANNHYEATCSLAKDNEKMATDFTMTVAGIGASNAVTEKYHFEMDEPAFEFKFASPWNTDAVCDQGGKIENKHCSGKIRLEWKLKNGHWILKKAGTNQKVDDGDANWAKHIKIESHPTGDDNHTITLTGNQTQGNLMVKRDHTHYWWKGTAEGVDGDPLGTKTLDDHKYEASLVVDGAGRSAHYNCTIDDCDNWGDGDCCDGNCNECTSRDEYDCRDHEMDVWMDWGAWHIKKIESSCGGSFDHQPSNDTYTRQTGRFTKHHSGKSLTCTFTVTNYDDSTWTFDRSWSFEDNC